MFSWGDEWTNDVVEVMNGQMFSFAAMTDVEDARYKLQSLLSEAGYFLQYIPD